MPMPPLRSGSSGTVISTHPIEQETTTRTVSRLRVIFVPPWFEVLLLQALGAADSAVLRGMA